MILFNLFAWLEKWGVILGVGLVFLPIVYDLIGIMTGRDLVMSIEFWGIVCQGAGGIVTAVSRYARRWGKKG